jgi:hypothetical protein
MRQRRPHPMRMNAVCLTLALAVPATAHSEERADALLARARAALGGADRLSAIQGVAASGQLRRILGSGPDAPELSGDARVDVLLPGRYLRVESLAPFPGAPGFTTYAGLDGDDAWTDQEMPPSAHGMIVVRRSADGAAAGGPKQSARTRSDYARWLLASLLLTDPAVPLAFVYGGVAESPDGRADVLDVTGPEGFTARLFLDAASHRPLMLSYRTRPVRGMVRRGEGGGAPRPAEIETAAAAAPPEVEALLHLGDFRPVGGLTLPHLLTTTFDGQPGEEWVVKEYKLNPTIKPETFRRRK